MLIHFYIILIDPAFNKNTLFTRKWDLNVEKKRKKCYSCSKVFMVLKVGQFGKWIRNTWKVRKCGVGEGWRRSVGSII
jgi:hypothetical protein